MDAEHRRILDERDWWRSLANRVGMELGGWDGMPPWGHAAFFKDGVRVEVPGLLAQAMDERLPR